jgi:hypothetical protein
MMRPAKLSSVLCLWLLAGISAVAQGRMDRDQSPPTGITLLPGYNHERFRTADSASGRIWKDQGLEIRYERGLGTANRVERAFNLLWSKEQIAGTNRTQVALTKDRVLLVTFSVVGMTGGSSGPINFYATVRTEEDVAEALVIILGFRR